MKIISPGPPTSTSLESPASADSQEMPALVTSSGGMPWSQFSIILQQQQVTHVFPLTNKDIFLVNIIFSRSCSRLMSVTSCNFRTVKVENYEFGNVVHLAYTMLAKLIMLRGKNLVCYVFWRHVTRTFLFVSWSDIKGRLYTTLRHTFFVFFLSLRFRSIEECVLIPLSVCFQDPL